jgi:hypothetical protein
MSLVTVQSWAALRVTRGTGLERPDPGGGGNNCKLAVGSADMLYRSVCSATVYGHSVGRKMGAVNGAWPLRFKDTGLSLNPGSTRLASHADDAPCTTPT